MVLAATLASVQFYTALEIPRPLPESFMMAVQPNGLCFWSCMFLASSASKRAKWLWRMRPRSEQGYPTSSEAADEEVKLVTSWARNINVAFIYIYISCSSLPWGNRSKLTYIFQMGCNHQLVNEDSGKKKTTKRAIAFLQFFTIGNFYANLRLHMGGFLSWNIVPEGRSLGRKVVQLSFPLLHLCICSITMTGRWDLKMVIGGNTTIWDQNQTQATCHVFEHPSLKEDCIVILKEQFKIFKSIFLKKFVRDRYTIIPSPPSS